MRIGSARKRFCAAASLASLLTVMDQASKAAIRMTMSPGDTIPLIDGILRFTYAQNFSGFSWWVPPMPAWANIALQVTLGAIVLMAFPVYLFYTDVYRRSIWADIAVVGIVAGCLGHLLDGLFVPYATDFIQVCNSPKSNLADLYSYAGIAAIAIEAIRVMRTKRVRWRGFHHFWAARSRLWAAFFEYVRRGFRSQGE